MAEQFNYDSLFSANSLDTPPGSVRHSKYDFAVAYPDPDNLPLEDLIESVRKGFEREGRSYCVGMIITFATVAVSSYRVSRLNIVAAVRGLPEATVIRAEAPFSQRLLLVVRALARPLIFLWRSLRSIPRLKARSFLLNLGLAALWQPSGPLIHLG